MNNLKRVLSLALSGIMLVGMMAVGAGAVDYKDFSDKDEITHTEAVSTMTLLGVIAGKDTGAFDPKGTVTRAEMAKMITVSLNGGKDPILGTKATPTYTDIKGHWAEKYIEYCASLNIIAGQGDGTFAPDATVTGTQAAKMMLTAMGYEAEVFKLVGADWDINTNREANDAGLYEELDDMNPAQGMSRDNAAQLIWNGIQQNTMKKTPKKSVNSGEIEWEYTLDNDPILAGKFKVFTNYGQLTDVDEGNLDIVDDTAYATSTGHTGDQTTFTKVGADYSSYLGQTVKVLYKKSDDVVGVAPVNANKTYTVALSDISADGSKVKFGGTKYTLDNGTSGSIDILTVTHDGDVASTTGTVTTLTGIDSDRRYSYNTVTFVDNDDDGKLEYAVVVETRVGKVTYSNNDEIIAGGTTYDREDDVIPEDVKKDGYVATYYNPFTANYTVVNLEKLNGTANENNESGAAKKYKFGDKWYFAGNTNNGDAIVAGNEYDFYAYNGVIVRSDLATSNATLDNLVMVVRKNTSGLNDQVRVIYSDGTVSTLSVVPDDYSNGDVNFSALAVATLYTVTETSKGYSFRIMDATATSANPEKIAKVGDHTFHNSTSNDIAVTSSKIDKFGTTAIADSAIVFIYAGNTDTNGSAKVVTGKQIKTLNATAASNDGNPDDTSVGYFTNKVDGLTRVTCAAVKMHSTSGSWDLPTIGAVNTNYGLVVSNGIQLDNTWAQYDLWTGEETVTVKEKVYLDLNSGNALRRQFAIVTYDKIANGEIENVAELTQSYSQNKNTSGNVGIAALYSVTSGKVWLSNDDALDRTSDTVYMYYDSSTTTAANIGKAEGELVRADSAASGVLVPNVKYVGDGSDLKFVLIDVKNMVKDAKAPKFTAANSTYGITGDTVALNFSKTSSIVKGETLTFKVEIPATKTCPLVTFTLTNAVNAADGSNTIVMQPVTAGASKRVVEYSVVATGAGNISVAHS